MTQTLLTLPPAVADFFRNAPDKWPSWLNRLDRTGETPIFIGNDPRVRRLGSGGGTVYALYLAWKDCGDRRPLEEWLQSGQRVILHSGGESRRLPAYAAIGKAFLPLPPLTGLRPRIHNQLLADFQLPAYQQTLVEAGPKAAALVTSGDVWLDFDPTDIPEVRADIAGIGMQVSPEVAQHFGVYFVNKDRVPAKTLERGIDRFLQKPTASEILSHTPKHDFFVDTGMWLLSANALEVIFRRCGWNNRSASFDTDDGLPRYLDLYTEVGTALGSGQPSAEMIEAGFKELSSSVVCLSSARFYHLGSSRQLLDSMGQLQWQALTPQRTFRIAVKSPEAPVHSERTATWLEGSLLNEPLRLDGDNLVTGVPPEASVRHLLLGQCLDVIPIGKSDYTVRPYHIDDTLRGRVDTGTICGIPAHAWLAARERPTIPNDVFTLSVYPVLSPFEITDDIVQWFFSSKPQSKITHLLNKKVRFSAAELPEKTNFARYFAQRRDGYAATTRRLFESVINDGQPTAFEQDFDALAQFCRKEAPQLHRWLVQHSASILTSTNRPEYQARFLAFLAALSEGKAKQKWAKTSFERLQSALVSVHQLTKSTPRLRVKEDQIVWARSPVRLDLAGGWTDTPPFCLEAGGNVVNVAVLLNGQPPIQVFLRPVSEPVIQLRSIDLGSAETITRFENLSDFRNPAGHFSLPKASLALAGFLPEFYAESPFRTLRAQLQALGSGLEISLLSAVPKGSGLGTSSILAATLLGATNRAYGLGWDQLDLYNRVLGVEQLLTTGGGWQDQAGALFPSLKLVQTQPGFSQIPTVRYLPLQAFQAGILNRTYLLYYTGATRMAKGILQEIVSNMFLGKSSTLRTLESIRANAEKTFQAVQLGDHASILRAIGRSWRLNKQLDPGTTTLEIERIIQTCSSDLAASKLLGAGGGGYMLLVAHDAAAGDRIRSALDKNPPNSRARFIDFAIADQGLQVTVS